MTFHVINPEGGVHFELRDEANNLLLKAVPWFEETHREGDVLHGDWRLTIACGYPASTMPLESFEAMLRNWKPTPEPVVEPERVEVAQGKRTRKRPKG